MNTIKIPFSGINRSVDEGISTDGQCMELINTRIKDGSVEPVLAPIPSYKEYIRCKDSLFPYVGKENTCAGLILY